MVHSSKTLSFVPGNLKPKNLEFIAERPNVDENALNGNTFAKTCHTLSVVLKLLIGIMNNNSSDMNICRL